MVHQQCFYLLVQILTSDIRCLQMCLYLFCSFHFLCSRFFIPLIFHLLESISFILFLFRLDLRHIPTFLNCSQNYLLQICLFSRFPFVRFVLFQILVLKCCFRSLLSPYRPPQTSSDQTSSGSRFSKHGNPPNYFGVTFFDMISYGISIVLW